MRCVRFFGGPYAWDKNGSITRGEIQALLQDLSEDSDEDACAEAMRWGSVLRTLAPQS